jgi:hypothetical protein
MVNCHPIWPAHLNLGLIKYRSGIAEPTSLLLSPKHQAVRQCLAPSACTRPLEGKIHRKEMRVATEASSVDSFASYCGTKNLACFLPSPA